MQEINVIFVGEAKDGFIKDGLAEYEKRLAAFCSLKNVCVRPAPVPEDPSGGEISRCLEKEADVICEKLGELRGKKIALCVEGKLLDSPGLAGVIGGAAETGAPVTFVIGGSHGLSERVKKACGTRLSFSPMTFPHSLMRLILEEQIYRAFTIIAGKKYHK